MRLKTVVLLTVLTLSVMAVPDARAAHTLPEDSSRAGQRPPEQDPLPLEASTFTNTRILDGDPGAVLSYSLPESVYEGIMLQNFADLCVFDAAGAPVPFQLRAPKGSDSKLEMEKEVPYFVWQPGNTGAEAPALADMEVNAKGGIVRIKGQVDGVPQPGAVSYLLDMGEFYEAMANSVTENGEQLGPENVLRRAIAVNLAGDNSFMAYVSMKTSADLVSWAPVGKTQVLARMLRNGAILDRNTLVLPKTAGRYLLVQLSDSEAPVFSFTAKASFGKTTALRQETLFSGTLSENKRSVSYVLPGRFPVTAMGFELAQPDMMAVRLTGTDDPKSPGTRYAEGFIYRLDKDGAVLTGDPFPVRNWLRYWELTAAGDIPFASAPALRVYWEPRELLFLARGDGPWTLAYGREQGVSSVPAPMLDQATVSPAREIPAPVVAEHSPAPGREEAGKSGMVLWLVLGLAVLFLMGVTVWFLKSKGCKKH